MREAVMMSARNPERLKELRAMVERVRAELLTFVSQRPEGQPSSSQQQQQGGGTEQPASGEGPVEQL